MTPNVGVWVRAWVLHVYAWCVPMCKSMYVQACVFMSVLAWVFVCVFRVCVCVSAYAFISVVGVIM